ncbi:MAG: Cof-type HAD-IIB family hydrolase [Ruthenibacterium sp.]
MPYKILFLDIDGTLLNSAGQITPATQQAIATIQRGGIAVVLASGRPYRGMLRFADELDLSARSGYIVSFNGGKIVDLHTGAVIYEQKMPQAQAARVFALAKKLHLGVVTYNEEGIVTEQTDNPYVQHESEITRLPFVPFDGDTAKLDFPIHKCLVVGETEQLIAAENVFKETLGDEISVCRSSPIFLEVTPAGVDKASGISVLLQKLGIATADAVACGDGFNDLPMIRLAGLGVALDNAPQGVKDGADLIVASNDADGVVEAIKHCWSDLF